MNTPENKAPDYGEPWKEAGDAAIIDLNNEYVGGYTKVARIITCVNACAGMSDPEKEIKAMREAIKEAHEALERVTTGSKAREGFQCGAPSMVTMYLRAEIVEGCRVALAKLKPFLP
jgi:hypothetical protein